MNYDQIFTRVYNLYGHLNLDQMLEKIELECIANGIEFDLEIEDGIKEAYKDIEFSLNNRG